MRKTHESINDQHSSQRACALLRARVRNNYGCGAVKCAFHLRAIAHVFDLPHKRHRTTSQKKWQGVSRNLRWRKMSLATLMCVCLLFFFCMFVYRASVLSLFSRSFIYFFVYLFFSYLLSLMLLVLLVGCLFGWFGENIFFFLRKTELD